MMALTAVDNDTLKLWYKNGKLQDSMVIIDIREPMEYAREHIPGSRNIPLSQLKKTDFSNEKNKSAIFHCQKGVRTRAAEATLLTCGFKENYCLDGGLEQWKACSLPTEFNRHAPIDIMRQVQISAGALVLIGIIFAYLFSSYFILLSLFIGLGLLLSGITGYCGMAKLLAYMPWNKVSNKTCCQIKKEVKDNDKVI